MIQGPCVRQFGWQVYHNTKISDTMLAMQIVQEQLSYTTIH